MGKLNTRINYLHCKLFLFILITIGLFFITIPHVNAEDNIPIIKTYVTDNAGILSPEFKSSLENVMIELESKTNGVQFVIYIDDIIPVGQSLEEYSLKIAEQNKIGTEENDNGLLLYIAIYDRKYRWETGYGLESTLNAALLGRISREQLEPSFKEEKYEEGLFNVVNTTSYILLNSEDSDVKKMIEESKSTEKQNPIKKKVLIIVLIVLIYIIIMFPRKRNQSSIQNNTKYTTSASKIFTGGFNRGGGGSGGFSGGGGSFGGGGHSGGW